MHLFEYKGSKGTDKIEEKMKEISAKLVKKYGVKKGNNLDYLKVEIKDIAFQYGTVLMRKEEYVRFLESEKKNIEKRRDAMLEKFHKLPLEEYEEMIKGADRYVENGNLDVKLVEMIHMVHQKMDDILEEIQEDIESFRKEKSGDGSRQCPVPSRANAVNTLEKVENLLSNLMKYNFEMGKAWKKYKK